jgi:hypothetical protein
MKITTILFIVAHLPGFAQFNRPDSLRIDSLNKATQIDYKNMLAQLGITNTRPGPSGNPQASNYANTDETKSMAGHL